MFQGLCEFGLDQLVCFWTGAHYTAVVSLSVVFWCVKLQYGSVNASAMDSGFMVL